MSTITSHPRRLRSIILSMMLALPVGLSACAPMTMPPAASGAREALAVVPAHDHGSGSPAAVSASQLALRQDMRMLWEQHMEWTRLAVVDFASGSAGFATTASRLLQNQADIGNAIKPYYGDAAAQQLTTLLKAHITDFVALFQAAKAGDQAGLGSATREVYANAQAIADFLAKANPRDWPRDEMRSMMKEHIDQTIVYGSDELNGRFAHGIAVYGQAEAHMMMMADDLSAGIIDAFPGRFR